MLKKFLLICAPVISLIVLAVGTPKIEGHSLSPVLCIGDSTLYACDGTVVSRKGFPEQLAQFSKRTVINDGICGGTTFQVLLNLEARHGNAHYAAIIIRVGLNDLRFNAWSPDMYRKLLRQANKRADKVIVVAWECANGEMGATNVAIEKIAREESCLYVVPHLSGSDFNGDAIHPNIQGSRKIADAVWHELSSRDPEIP